MGDLLAYGLPKKNVYEIVIYGICPLKYCTYFFLKCIARGAVRNEQLKVLNARQRRNTVLMLIV